MFISRGRVLASLVLLPVLVFYSNVLLEQSKWCLAALFACAAAVLVFTLHSHRTIAHLSLLMSDLHADLSVPNKDKVRCSLFVHHQNSKMHEIARYPPSRREKPVSIRTGIVGLCFRHKLMMKIDDTFGESRGSAYFFLSLGFTDVELPHLPRNTRSYIADPVELNGSVIAVILVRSTLPNHLDEKAALEIERYEKRVRDKLIEIQFSV